MNRFFWQEDINTHRFNIYDRNFSAVAPVGSVKEAAFAERVVNELNRSEAKLETRKGVLRNADAS